METITTGILNIKPLEAVLHEDLEKLQFINESFCVIKLGEKTIKTKLSKGTLLKPTWKETITLHKNAENIVKIEIWNKNQQGQILLVGCTEIPLALIKDSGYSSTWYDLKKEAYNVGQVLIATEFLSDSKKDEEEAMELESKKSFEDLKGNELIAALAAAMNKTTINKNLSNRKASEIIVPKDTKEKAAPRYRGSVEFNSQGKLFDIHDPQFLKKKMSAKNEEFAIDIEKERKSMGEGNIKLARKASESDKKPQW